MVYRVYAQGERLFSIEAAGAASRAGASGLDRVRARVTLEMGSGSPAGEDASRLAVQYGHKRCYRETTMSEEAEFYPHTCELDAIDGDGVQWNCHVTE